MKIVVKEDSRNFRLHLPTSLMLNRCVACAVCREVKKHEVKLNSRQLNRLFKVLKDYRKTHPDWVLVEVHGAKGEYVQISI